MITIKNLRNEKPTHSWDVVVSKPSVFGNPYPLKNVNNDIQRDQVCELYDIWFEQNMDKLKKHLDMLNTKHKLYGNLNLYCWCAPKRCHAETIKTYLERGEE